MDPNDEIVISGISGKFPECNNVEEFMEALLNGVDLVKNNGARFPRGVMGIPSRAGIMPEVDKFDATYFGVHAKQTDMMDPRHRLLCETVYECIVDAGYNPKELRGSNTGVYAALTMLSNPEKLREREDTDGYTNIGLSICMAANRISYCFDFKGKSYTLDTACSSTLYAFVNAVHDLKSGKIDAAVVCGSQMIFHPHESSEFNKLNMLAQDGKCKVFSTLRDGYARAEATISVLLQRKSVCRRTYATVMGATNNADGYKIEGITYPSAEMQLKLMKDLYHNGDVNSDEINYVEAHGTGTPIGDVQELRAIESMFCQNRKTPLLVGAVKSNMGHAEVASGLCSLSKVLIAMETGIIPANLHVEPLDTELPGIKDGKIKVVTKNLPWTGGVVAVNCFGFGGANAHVALKSNSKEKPKTYRRPKYRLVQVSGRTEEAVNHFLDEVERNSDDEDFLALVDEIHKMNCDGHQFRGYTILGDQPKREVGRYTKVRPIWLIYTGMGSQWLGMGRDMMYNEVFRNTIRRCAAALEPYNLDLEHILTTSDVNTFENSTNSFVAIAAVEVALTDLLYSLGIVPDGIAGHSLGEVGCSYGDGHVSPEEAVLLAYARGYATQCVKTAPGAMAAVGLSKEECLKLLPEDVIIACQNGKTSVTISGPETVTTSFVEKLSSEGIFAKKVNSAGIAYHSKYIKDTAPYIYDFVKKVLKNPTVRSPKWLSTSVTEKQKDEPWAQYNCAEYHRNNFCNTVLFDRVYQHIPEDAIVIEVAPHGLLQAILKRELHPNCTVLPLANRNSPNNEEFFLSAIGKLYIAGAQPNLKNLYKGVTYPVSRGTKMISPMVKWDHSVSWVVPIWEHKDSFGQIIRVNLSNEQHAYLSGHNIEGRVLMPATGYLELAWRTLAHLHLKEMDSFPVVIENVRFKRATVLPQNTEVSFLVNIMKQSGYFEIFEGGSVVCTGTIYTIKDTSVAYCDASCPEVVPNDHLPLTSDDIYKECRLRRYMYEGLFQGLKQCDVQGLKGRIKWQGNFTSFLDTMLHLTVIAQTKRDLLLPTAIEKVVVDPQKHLESVSNQEDLLVFFNQDVNVLRSGGVEISGADSSKIPRRKQVQEEPVLETYEFVSYEILGGEENEMDAWISTAVHIILQNTTGLFKRLRICEFSNESATLIDKITNVINLQPMVEVEYHKYNKNDDQPTFDVVVVGENIVKDINTVSKLLNENGMILYQGEIIKTTLAGTEILFKAISAKDTIHLLRPNREFPSKPSVVHVRNFKFDWLEQIKSKIQAHDKGIVYLVSEDEEISGLIGLMKCLLTEPLSPTFRCVFIQDSKMEKFSLESNFYRDQLKKNLTFNVLRNGKWGTYVHLPLKPLEYKQVQDAAASILTIGDLSTLTWVEKPSIYVKSEKSEKVYVYYSALNFKDVMVASGKLQLIQSDQPTVPEVNIGIEYAGVTDNGRRVMGLLSGEGLSLQVQTDPEFTWDVPNGWSLEEAATVPTVYATCYFGMIVRGNMQPGESILIHAGTGGIGMAAIAIALDMGCTVFTTVGSQEKRDYLKKLYPKLKDENIGNSRNTSFRKMIMQNTNGKGVDLVLNSLAGELFQESLKCVGWGGKFIEIGKVDQINRTPIDSNMFLKNTSFHGVHLDHFFGKDQSFKKVIGDLLTEGIKRGVVKPLPRTVFREVEIEDALRFLSSGKHKGKVIIELRKEDSSTYKAPLRTITAIPKVYFHPEKSYILIGGLGGVGLELANWMITRGATKIVLNSRRQISNGYQSYCLKKWSKWNGITVKINTDDTTSLEGAQKLVAFAKRLGPVGGVFNMALVLKDCLIENQTRETYEAVFKPKIISGSNMDAVTRSECSELDHFVVFSSIACGRGNSGQSNYGMANSALEQLCEKRRREQLPALAVQWGTIGEVGAVVKTNLINKFAEYMIAQNIASCIEALERFMLEGSTVGSSVVLPNKTESNSKQRAKTPAEAVAHILGIRNIDLIDTSLTLSQVGLDSLMVAEIKQTLYRNYQLEVSTEEIRDLTFSKLISMSAVDKNGASTPVQNGHGEDTPELVTAILPEEPILEMNRAKDDSTVFLVHPIDGNVNALNTVAKLLMASVYGLQCTKETDCDSIQEYASYFIRQVKSRKPQGPYVLCGYSFGAAVAIEMGFQLEENGESVELILLDGSPAYVKTHLESSFVKYQNNVEKSKTAILVKFVSGLINLNEETIFEELDRIATWEKRLRFVADLVSKETQFDADHVATSADLYYKRFLAGFMYKPENIFMGKVTLIRVDSSELLSSEDYGLQQLCNQKVDVLKLKGDHASILLGENATIISEKINNLL